MAKKTLVEMHRGREVSRSIEIFDKPAGAAAAASPLAWKILVALAERPTYPNDLARKMRVHEQKIYYHVRRLLDAGLLEVIGEQHVRGALTKVLAPTADAFGFEMPASRAAVTKRPAVSPQIKEFFHEFIRRGFFDGSIVVGAPTMHGPYNTAARDGYYTAHLAMFLGELCSVPHDRFLVKPDTEVRAEKKEKRNMILVGGPIVNTVVADVALQMKIKMDYVNGQWKIVSALSGKEYDHEGDVLIAKVRNPWDESKRIIVLAGLKAEGTKTCIIALTQKPDKVLKDYDRNKDFYRVLRGLDNDGDGHVDDVEVLE
ncbi:MAG: S-layer protein [Candidatus Aenigmarchaeota archaeon]|nr:S-layer protein [Candidatus Aenigmarchaeota archaeon]